MGLVFLVEIPTSLLAPERVVLYRHGLECHASFRFVTEDLLMLSTNTTSVTVTLINKLVFIRNGILGH
jgi:hypothetical protein